jgi:autophagy-related protein 17
MKQITSLQALLPPPIPPPPLEPLLTEQESISTYMAEHLSSLTTHYDQMADALREEEEAGITLDEENMQGRGYTRVFLY